MSTSTKRGVTFEGAPDQGLSVIEFGSIILPVAPKIELVLGVGGEVRLQHLWRRSANRVYLGQELSEAGVPLWVEGLARDGNGEGHNLGQTAADLAKCVLVNPVLLELGKGKLGGGMILLKLGPRDQDLVKSRLEERVRPSLKAQIFQSRELQTAGQEQKKGNTRRTSPKVSFSIMARKERLTSMADRRWLLSN